MQEELLEQQYVFRPYIPSKDIHNLLCLLTLIENFDHDGENTTETSLRQQLNWPNHKPEQDCWIIEESVSSHMFIGYCSVFAQTSQRCTLYAAIHPKFRRRGLASVLLKKAMSRAREIGAVQVILYANAHNTAAHAFLLKYQFQCVGSSWVLQNPNALALPEINLPSGYFISNYASVQNIEVLLNVMNHSYADLWGHAENDQATEEDVIQKWLATADPEGIFLVFAPNGDIAGFCRANHAKMLRESEFSDNTLFDEIEQPGVVPGYRQSYLYRSLAVVALAWLRTVQERTVLLQSWGDDERTIAIYQEVGFSLIQHFFAYQYQLSYS